MTISPSATYQQAAGARWSHRLDRRHHRRHPHGGAGGRGQRVLSETALVDAINTANRLSGSDTLNLADGCTYKLTSSHGGTGNGLPVITSVIELVGRPNIITRSGGFFRIAEVSSTGNFTLTRVALDNGSTTGSGGGVPEPRRGDVHQRRQRPDNNTAGLFGTGGGLSNVDTPSGTAPAATFTGASVMGNTAGGRGGGIYNGNEDALTMTSTTVKNNRSTLAQGGGIAAISSTTSLTSTPVSVNHADTLLLGGAGGVFRSEAR